MKKNGIIRVCFMLAFMLAMAWGATAWAATVTFDNGNGTNVWSDPLNWDTGNLPTASDDAVIDDNTTCLMDQDAEVLTLTCGSGGTGGAGAGILQANVGDTVTLTVNGNIDVEDPGTDGDGLQCVNGTGRINIVIQAAADLDGDETANNDADGTIGLNFHSLTIADAAVTYTGDQAIWMTGDLVLTGNSTLTPANAQEGTLVMRGGSAAAQLITVPGTSYCEFVNISFANNAVVTTASDLTVREIIDVTAAGSSFIASAGTITLNPSTAALATPANGSGTSSDLTFFDLFISAANAMAPVEPYTVAGDFTKSGAAAYTGTAANEVTFTNTSGKEIIKSGAGGLTFGDIIVTTGSDVTTYATFNVADDLTVAGTGSFVANGGTITFDLGGATAVDAASGSTLEFYHLTTGGGGNTLTAQSFKIKGDLTIGGGDTFTGDPTAASVITFDNILQRTITNGNALNFFQLHVADGSSVTTATDFTVTGGATAGAGITILGTGVFDATANALTLAGGAAKTIVVSSTGTLTLWNVTVADAAANATTTASDFTIAGTALTLAGVANGSFAATAGTITLTGAAALTAPSAARLIFNNLVVNNVAVTVTAGDFVEFIGNLTVDGASGTFTPATDATCTFNGTVQQTIGGTSTDATAIDFGILVLNKAGTTPADEVVLAIDATVVATGALTLTDGILNLGSQTLSQGGTLARTNGFIDGATGTYKTITGHTTTILSNTVFEPVSGTPTLYNLNSNVAEALDGALTVTGDLDLVAAAFTITGQTLTVEGDMSRTSGSLVHGGSGSLILDGTGLTTALSNSYFSGTATAHHLTVKRAETLGGNLEVDGTLTMNAGMQALNLGAYTLDLDGTIVIISGSITAGATSTVDLVATITEIPANMFTSNECGNITVAANMTLGSDLTINGTLTGVFDITTGDNVLTFGPSATKPAFTDAACVIGNMKQTVTNSATLFEIGGGTATNYRPVTLQFANAGSSQVVQVSVEVVNPTLGRGGDPTKPVDLVWTITPEGTAPGDSLKLLLGWDTNDDANNAAIDNQSFAAKWRTANSSWKSYRDNCGAGTITTPGTPASDVLLTLSSNPIMADSLGGDWAVFTAAAATDVSKDAAIATDQNKVVITTVSPNPVASSFPFAATVQLQDQYGNPITVTGTPYTVALTRYIGTTNLDAPTTRQGVIPVGSSSVVVNGLSFTVGGGESGLQLKSTCQTCTGTFQDGISEKINIVADPPAAQGSGITFSAVGTTEMTVTWTLGANCIVVGRAGSAVSDFPVDGSTYISNSIFGAGSRIGDGVVVYKGTGTTVNVTGLAPNTTYHFRVFAYSGTTGNENYLTIVGANNPKSQATTGGTDDDIDIGANDSRLAAKPIGTNTPIVGTLKTTSDEDWYSFSITNATPNVRIKLTGLPDNYNIEMYNTSGRRVRRAMRTSTNSETIVFNNLDPGTYAVRIYGVDGAFHATNTYTLQVSTNGTEYFSVTP